MDSIKEAFKKQKEYFESLKPLDLERRKLLLQRLKSVIEKHEREIIQALKLDLGKSQFEAVIAETQFILNEIDHALKKLKKWSKSVKVKSPWAQFPSKSYIQPMPLGNILIIGPWNYPFQLLISPLVGAIAAGNTAIIKPSEISSHTSKVVANLINQNFDPRELLVIEGAVEETTALLECPFNHIFYTGNSTVGRIVMRKAAENLTPVTLELGGKSPCLVYDVKNIEVVSDRIVWGKFFNAGQTCVAPDYVITSSHLKSALLKAFKSSIEKFFGVEPSHSNDYGRIINQKHFERLESYLDEKDILLGGVRTKEERYFSPTVVHASEKSKIMEEEIFGPILPILIEDDFDNALKFIQKRDRPLAAYLFTDNENFSNRYNEEFISGGMCINDTIVHLTNDHLPFGGVGESGMGAYHGETSFRIFSHYKSVMKRGLWLDLPLRYPPYGEKVGFLRWILKYFG